MKLNDIDRGLLFEPPIEYSPFLRWKADHQIKTHFSKEAKQGEEWLWLASAPGEDFPDIGPDDCGGGDTELEACYECARKYKLVWFQTGKVAV